MRADRTIRIQDCDRTLEDGLKGLPDIEPLGLAADQHRYRLELARHLAGRLGCCGARRLCNGGGFTRRRDGIELGLQLRLCGGQLGLQLGELGGGLRLVALSLLLCLGRIGGSKRSLGGRQLRIGPQSQIFRHAHRRHGLCGHPERGPGGEFRLIRLPGCVICLRGTDGRQRTGTGV